MLSKRVVVGLGESVKKWKFVTKIYFPEMLKMIYADVNSDAM